MQRKPENPITADENTTCDLSQEVKDERDRLELIIENTNTQLAYLDNQFNLLKVNSAYARSAGKQPEELIGKNYFDLFPDSDYQKVFELARDSGQPVEYDAKTLEDPDKSEQEITYCEWRLAPVKNQFGEVQGLVLSLTEVSGDSFLHARTKRSALKLLAITIGIIIIAESVIMGTMVFFPNLSPLMMAFVDVTALILIVFPLLYIILLRPLMNNISERKKAQQSLQNAYEKIKVTVEERTAELVEMNEKLRIEIGEREKIEQEIEHERKRLFSVLDELPASVHLLRSDHTIVFANRYFREQFGEEIEKPCHKILHGESEPCETCNAFHVYQSGIPGEFEEEHTNGKLYRVYNYPFTDTDKSNLILQLGIDITDHKKAVEALRKSEERFRILVNSIDDTVFTLDRKKRFLEIYGNLFDKLGISAQYTLNKSLASVFDTGAYKVHNTKIGEALKGEHVMYEWSVSKEDELHHIQNSLSPIYDDKNKVDGVVGVARDITIQKKLEKQLIETEKLLTVAKMSAMISHEFRNSLTSVRMILELQLESDNLKTPEKKSLSVALSSVNHMEDVVSQLVDFSRPKPMTFKPGDINQVVSESINFTRVHSVKKQIVLKADLNQGIPSLEIDQHQFKEALINLILNAIQAISIKTGGDQSRTISLKTDRHVLKSTLSDFAMSEVVDLKVNNKIKAKTPELILEEGMECVLISVKDTGVGIKSDYLNRIFNPFFTTFTLGGTGLGLSMVKRTINAHKGIIRVESQVGEGSTFYIYLPINKQGRE
jgi:PAS domain S-box-containing protein